MTRNTNWTKEQAREAVKNSPSKGQWGANSPGNAMHIKGARKAGKGKSFADWLGPEDRLQVAVIKYVKLQYPGCMVHHSPNEGRRTAFERFRVSQLALSPGFPDLVLVYNNTLITLELKVRSQPSAEQLIWNSFLNQAGIPSAICWGFEQSKEFIDLQFKK